MPKLKTNKAASKRYKITATGKVKRTNSGKIHLLSGKSRKTKRGIRKATMCSCTNIKAIKKLLPYG